MTLFRTPTRYSFLNYQIYFCPHIDESANIAESVQYHRKGPISPNFFRNFWPYNIAHIGPPPVFWVSFLATISAKQMVEYQYPGYHIRIVDWLDYQGTS